MEKENKPNSFNIFEYIATFLIFIIVLKFLKYILPTIKQNSFIKEILGLLFCIIAFSGIYFVVHHIFVKVRK